MKNVGKYPNTNHFDYDFLQKFYWFKIFYDLNFILEYTMEYTILSFLGTENL